MVKLADAQGKRREGIDEPHDVLHRHGLVLFCHLHTMWWAASQELEVTKRSLGSSNSSRTSRRDLVTPRGREAVGTCSKVLTVTEGMQLHHHHDVITRSLGVMGLSHYKMP